VACRQGYFAPSLKTKYMCNHKKKDVKIIPTLIVSALLIVSGVAKITGLHPLIPHFIEMGIYSYLKILGSMEILFALLFITGQTRQIGLLLLSAYLGGAMAAELPYGMIAAPTIPLILVWIAAYIRQPAIFRIRKNNSQHLKATS
jgi:hypothetical protein